MVADPGLRPNIGPWSKGSKASIWPCSATAASMSAKGVPAPQISTSSAGS